MASPQAQGPNVNRSRAGYLGALTKLYKSVDQLVSSNAPIEDAVDSLNRINARYAKYLESHDLCVVTNPESNAELQVSHDMAQQEHDEVCVLLQAYISGCAKPTTPPIRSLFTSRASSRKRSAKPAASQGSRPAPSQVSSVRSEKLIEAKVQAEVTKRRIEQLKAIQEMKKRQQQLNDEIELQESVNKLEELNAEVTIRQQEEVRRELGSDYESDEEREDVTQPTVLQPKPVWQDEKKQTDDMLNLLKTISKREAEHPAPDFNPTKKACDIKFSTPYVSRAKANIVSNDSPAQVGYIPPPLPSFPRIAKAKTDELPLQTNDPRLNVAAPVFKPQVSSTSVEQPRKVLDRVSECPSVASSNQVELLSRAML